MKNIEPLTVLKLITQVEKNGGKLTIVNPITQQAYEIRKIKLPKPKLN